MESGFFIGMKRPPDTPKRIVSLVPSQTELLADLGLEQEVKGITKFCIHPDTWFRIKERIGGTKNPNLEKIHSLAPDLVIANKEENEKEPIAAIAEFAPVWVSNVTTLDDALGMIRDIGQLTHTLQQARSITENIRTGFDALAPLTEPPPRVAYLIWRDPWMVAGAETFIHNMLTKAGLKNVFEDRLRYPEITLSDLEQKQPDFILLSSEPFPFKERHAREIRSVVTNGRILFVDGEPFSWYGSRLLKTPAYLLNVVRQMK